MFSQTPAFSGFSVDDIDRARQFYADVVGIRVSEQNGMLWLHLAGDRDTLVYPKPDHTPATFTILNFRVPDVEAAVDALVARGSRSRSATGPTSAAYSASTAPRSPGSPTRPATCSR